MGIEMIIDENGDVLFNRDDERVVEIIKRLTEELSYKEVLRFISEKPLNIKGEKNYPSFCG